MKSILSIPKIYAFLLIFLPSLIAVSWLNVYLGNAQLSVSNYVLTFVLPAIVLAYLVSLLTAERLNDGYAFTFTRVMFTLVGLIGSLFLFSYILTFFGFSSQFLTAVIPSVVDYDKLQVLGITTNQTDPRELASKFYSFQLAVAFIMIILFYSIATFLFKSPQELIGHVHKTVVIGSGKPVKRARKAKSGKKSKKRK